MELKGPPFLTTELEEIKSSEKCLRYLKTNKNQTIALLKINKKRKMKRQKAQRVKLRTMKPKAEE